MVEKRELDPIKSMVSRNSSIQFSNFMATTGIVTQTSFLTRLTRSKLHQISHLGKRLASSSDLPIHIGVFILICTKLRILEFYYDVLDYYLSGEDF